MQGYQTDYNQNTVSDNIGYHPMYNADVEEGSLHQKLTEMGANIDRELEAKKTSIYHLYLVCCVVAFIGFVAAMVSKLFSFQLVLVAYYAFSAAVCAMIGILNFPNMESLHIYRSNIRSAFRFASLVFGQALIFIYLGLSIFVSIWPEDETKRAALMILIAFIAGGACLATGFGGLLIAHSKRGSLESIRTIIKAKISTDNTRTTEQLITEILSNNKSPHHNFSVAEFPCFIGCFLRDDIPLAVPSLTDSALLFNAIDIEGNGYLTVAQVAEWIDTYTPVV